MGALEKKLTYKLEHFEGPLDLLLHLIEKNKIDIYDIPIVDITEQYLEYVKNMEEDDLELVSSFLLMAATLLEIKSRLLLPKEQAEEGEEADPRGELVERLLEYKKYKYIGQELQEMGRNAKSAFQKQTDIPKEVVKYVPPVDPEALLGDLALARVKACFEDVIRRKEASIDRIRAKFGIIRRERISLAGRVMDVLCYARSHGSFSFRHMLHSTKDRMEVVVSFLAVLELMKLGKIQITQERPFSDLDITLVDGKDDGNDAAIAELAGMEGYD